jgi:hypothetical protein
VLASLTHSERGELRALLAKALEGAPPALDRTAIGRQVTKVT